MLVCNYFGLGLLTSLLLMILVFLALLHMPQILSSAVSRSIIQKLTLNHKLFLDRFSNKVNKNVNKNVKDIEKYYE